MRKITLQKLIDNLSFERKQLLEDLKVLQNKILDNKNKLGEAQYEMFRLDHGGTELIISDHALLRYLERHKGFDKNSHYENLYKYLVDNLPAASDGEYETGGLRVIIKNGEVITII